MVGEAQTIQGTSHIKLVLSCHYMKVQREFSAEFVLQMERIIFFGASTPQTPHLDAIMFCSNHVVTVDID